MTCQNVSADPDIRAWSASKVDYTKAIEDRHTHVPSCLPGMRLVRFSGAAHAILACRSRTVMQGSFITVELLSAFRTLSIRRVTYPMQ